MACSTAAALTTGFGPRRRSTGTGAVPAAAGSTSRALRAPFVSPAACVRSSFILASPVSLVILFYYSVSRKTGGDIIEHSLRIIRDTGKAWRSSGASTEDYERMRTNLIQALAAVLEESLVEPRSRDAYGCDYHNKLVSCLSADDAIVSLNYDCLIDYALKNGQTNNWNPAYGYCLPRPKGPNASIGEEYWSPKLLPSNNNTLRLLKLHGSMNFRKKGRLIALKERPYTRQNNNLRPEIIPPEWNKKLEGHFQRIWRQAAIEIHKAKTIVFIGYSFPTADLHTAALFRVSVSRKLNNVVIVNPNKDAQHRTLDVVKAGLTPSTRVKCFDCFSEFAQIDRSAWERTKPLAPT
jgi:hypothetical protein